MASFDSAIPFVPSDANAAPCEPPVVAHDRDTALMLAFQQGQADAFEELVQRNHARVFRVLCRFLGRSTECEDLSQEVFLRVFRSAPRYVPSAKFSTWLYRVTANVALNRMRSSGRLRTVPMDADSDESGREYQPPVAELRPHAPEAGLERSEMARQVEEAVAGLPDNQRVAITLNKYEGLRYEEIAAVLECSTMAVKSLLSRARANLRDQLERYISDGVPVERTPARNIRANRVPKRNLGARGGLDDWGVEARETPAT